MTQEKTAKIFMAKYRCRGCSHEFQFSSHTGSSVRCPRCRGGACDPTTPAANVFTGSRVSTTREAKLTRYQARSTRMLVQFQEHMRSFNSFMEMLEISKDMKNRVNSVLEEALQEGRKIKADKIALHKERTA